MLQKLQCGRVSSMALRFFAVEALKKMWKICSLTEADRKHVSTLCLLKSLVLHAYSIIMVHVIIAGEWRCEQKEWGKFNSTGLLELTGWTIERQLKI